MFDQFEVAIEDRRGRAASLVAVMGVVPVQGRSRGRFLSPEGSEKGVSVEFPAFRFRQACHIEQGGQQIGTLDVARATSAVAVDPGSPGDERHPDATLVHPALSGA